MKLSDKFLERIRSLSEGTKGALLAIFILAAATLLFKGWLASVSYRLSGLSIAPVSEEVSPVPLGIPVEPALLETPPLSAEGLPKDFTAEKPEALGPLAGLKESLNSLQDLVPSYQVSFPEKKSASLFLTGMILKITDLSGQGWNYIKSLPSSIFRSKKWIEN